MLISLDAGGDYYILLKTVRPERWRDNGRAAARHAFMTASCGSWQVTGPALGCEVARSRRARPWRQRVSAWNWGRWAG